MIVSGYAGALGLGYGILTAGVITIRRGKVIRHAACARGAPTSVRLTQPPLTPPREMACRASARATEATRSCSGASAATVRQNPTPTRRPAAACGTVAVGARGAQICLFDGAFFRWQAVRPCAAAPCTRALAQRTVLTRDFGAVCLSLTLSLFKPTLLSTSRSFSPAGAVRARGGAAAAGAARVWGGALRCALRARPRLLDEEEVGAGPRGRHGGHSDGTAHALQCAGVQRARRREQVTGRRRRVAGDCVRERRRKGRGRGRGTRA